MNNVRTECPYDYVMQEDIEYVAGCKYIPYEKLCGRTVLVTGAAGLIGTQIVLSLLCRNQICNSDIKVLALVRNVEKAREKFSGVENDENLNLIAADMLMPFDVEGDVDYIIHCAGITGNPKLHIEFPAITIKTAVIGTTSVLELALRKRIKGMVYLSSWEVYGVPEPEHGPIRESDYGYIDIENVRSSYKESKRLCEELCVAYAAQYNLPVVMGRISIAFGAGVADSDKRVFAQFARSVIEKKDIILHTKGDTVRSHCYVRDVITALIVMMLKGEKGKAYNIANKNASKSIAEMAEMVVSSNKEAGIKVVYDIEDDLTKYGYNQSLICILDTERLENLGWRPSVDLEDMYKRMIQSIRCRM